MLKSGKNIAEGFGEIALGFYTLNPINDGFVRALLLLQNLIDDAPDESQNTPTAQQAPKQSGGLDVLEKSITAAKLPLRMSKWIYNKIIPNWAKSFIEPGDDGSLKSKPFKLPGIVTGKLFSKTSKPPLCLGA